MTVLTPAERRALRAGAHHLQPCVSIGQHGLTAAVLNEIDVALRAHELVKVRVHNDDRDEREALLGQVCKALDAAPVQHLGKLLILWRPAPEPIAEAPEPAVRAKPRAQRAPGKKPGAASNARKSSTAKSGAKARGYAPGARRRRAPH